jgi:hypothetical protein
VEIQRGTISRRQAVDSGVPPDRVDWLVRTGRWQVLTRGVYSVYSGPPNRDAELWAGLLRAGPGAVLSHQTAAEVCGLSDRRSTLVHLTIPARRYVTPIQGVIIHRSHRVDLARHPVLLPPQTRIEETVLDLVQASATFDSAFNIVCAACQRRLTTARKLLLAMRARAKLRWREDIRAALGDIGAGAHSLLEYRYIHRVERPHGLPEAKRQARVDRQGGRWYLDNLYEEYGLCVELDGQEAHPDDRRWQDIRRANAVLVRGAGTLRYGWTDVNFRHCLTAAQVGRALANLGWQEPLRRCSADCAVVPSPH